MGEKPVRGQPVPLPDKAPDKHKSKNAKATLSGTNAGAVARGDNYRRLGNVNKRPLFMAG